MKRRKNSVFLMAAFAAIIIVSAAFLSLSQKTIFPEKNSHSEKDHVSPNQAHIARYRNSEGNRATVSVTSADTEKRAVEKVDNMTKGMGGMFSIPEILEINGLKIYYTQGGGEYHYYYSKNNLVIWIAFNSPDRIYRSRLIDEAVKSIGG